MDGLQIVHDPLTNAPAQLDALFMALVIGTHKWRRAALRLVPFHAAFLQPRLP